MENVRRENTEQLIQNIAQFDDMQFAMTNIGDRFRPGSPASMSQVVVLSYRVRRLFQLAQTNPKEVIAVMRAALSEALEEWPAAFKEELALWEKTESGLTKNRATKHDTIQMRAVVATYLLGEIGNGAELSLLYQAYQKEKLWIDAIDVDHYRFIPQTPVPPPMSLFAMHRNIERIPPHSLSPAVAEALNSYVAWAKDRVPPAQMYRGVTPDSKLDESNPMIGVVDPGKISIQNLPTMDMPVYPVNFKDGTAMQNYETAPYLGELAQEWSRKLEALIPLIIADIK